MYDKILNKLDQKHKLIVTLFFTFYLIISLSVLKDYGLSWDEQFQWKSNGEVVYNYIFYGNKTALLEGTEKYHGPVFELALVFIEKVLNLSDTRDVYLMRHLVTFLAFFVGLIFFYFLCKRCFKDWKIALIGCVFLALSPRIFADSFFNSKDLPFFSFFIIGMYGLLVFHEKPSYKNAILFALASAFAIDIRILGIIIPLTSIIFIIIEILFSVITKNKIHMHFGSYIIFIISLVAFTILFWPVLWEGPIYHFLAAFEEMSKFHWGGKVLYLGESIPAPELPWHYLFTWIFISVSIPYLILFLTGFIFIGYEMIKKPVDFLLNRSNHMLLLIWFLLPLLMVVLLKSVVYDSWRHVFFIYPAFIMISLYGLKQIGDLFKKARMVFAVLILGICSFNLYTMVELHPNENIYFNCLAGDDMQEVKQNFELDYWGVSSKQALEYLLSHDTSSSIKIYAEQFPQELNIKFLPLEQRQRINFSGIKEANYFVGQYRWHKENYSFKNEVYSVMVGNAKIMSVFKLEDWEKINYVQNY